MVRRPSTALLAVALLGLVALTRGDAATDGVIWVYPPPNSLLTESPVAVFGYLTGAAQPSLDAMVMSEEGSALPKRESLFLFKGKIFSGSIPLSPGRNNVRVGGAILPLVFRPGSVEAREGDFRRPVPHGGKIDACNECHTFVRGDLTLKKRLPDLCLGCHRLGAESERAVLRKNKHTQEVTPDCLRCHQAHVSFEPKLLRAVNGSCTPCHQGPAYTGYVHDNGASAEACTTCHDAHGSAWPSLIRGEPVESCKKCHQALISPERWPRSFHAPVEAQRCFDCHTAHPQGQRRLLKAAIPELCRSCHPMKAEGGHRGRLGDCLACHQHHSSDRRRLVKSAVTDLCLSCHPERRSGSGAHAALKEGCSACHDPHNAAGKRDSQEVCGSCHRLRDTEFQSAHGGLVMTTTVQCAVCHDVHASTRTGLLKGTVHYPLKNGGCASCHMEKENRIDLRYEGSDNCLRCHGQITGTSVIKDIDKVHKPVYQIDCIACHNPHLGVRRSLLLEEPVALCSWCHGILLRGVDNIHGVFKEGGTCYTCHLPHISDFKPLLKRPEEELCLRCHVKVLPTDAAGRRMQHGAVGKSRCTGCHNPHGTNTEKLLRGTRDSLCATCHPKALANAEGAPWRYLHGPVGTGNCTACHLLAHTHAANGDSFLRAKGSRICALCHETRPDHVKENYRAKMREVQNDCLSCHAPHGGNDKFLTRVVTEGESRPRVRP